MNTKNTNKQKGFTLIEIMIVVAILGILSAIALPSYQEYVKKSRRTDAKVTLLRIAQLQESFFAQKLSYAKNLSQLGLGANTISSDDSYYNISINAANTLPAGCSSGSTIACTSYQLRAAATSTQATDLKCKGFGMDNVGRKLATGTGSTSWGTSSVAEKTKISECWGK